MITTNAIATTAVASGSGSQEVAAIIKQKLCKPYCLNQSIQPTINVVYSLGDVTNVVNGSATTTFVEVKAQGTIQYVPKGCSNCSTLTQSFADSTVLAFVSSSGGTGTAVLAQGSSDGIASDVKCTTAHSYIIATDVKVTCNFA